MTVDFLCEQILVKNWLGIAECGEDFDTIRGVSCGIGAQVVSAVSPYPTYPACDTVTMGGRFGQAWGQEGCKECGHCMLPYTAGICPLTACSKELLNGPCGGSENGKCEVDPENLDCGWNLIYQRLKSLNRLDAMMPIRPPQDWSKSHDGGPRKLIREDVKL